MRTLTLLPLAALAAMIGCGDKDEVVNTGDTDTDTDSDTDTDTDSDTDTDTDTDTTPPPTDCDLQTPGTICTWMGIEGVAFYGPEGEARVNAALYSPVDMTFGPDGAPYVIDWNNHRVRTVHDDDTVWTILGTGVIGDGFFDPITSTWTAAPLPALGFKINHPSHILFDPADPNFLYIAAWHNSRIERYNFTTLQVEYYAGNGTRSFLDSAATVDPTNALLTAFDLPSSLAFDDDGNMFVSDQANQLIRMIDPAKTVTSFAGILKSPGYNGDGLDKSATKFSASTGQLADPSNKLEYHDGALYFVDTENNLVRKLDLTTNLVTIVAGVYVDNPVLIDTNGDYIGDLQVGLGAYAGDGGLANAASLNRPRDLAVAEDGTIYVADTDNHCVRVITPDGMINSFAGRCTVNHLSIPGEPSTADNVPAVNATLSSPFGVALDADGNVYISDTLNMVIRVVYQ